MIKLIHNYEQIVKPTMFPDGTSQVWKLRLTPGTPATIIWYFESEGEFLHLAQLVDLLRNEAIKIEELYIPFLPYARQDKMISNDSTFALGFKELNPKVGLIYGDGMYYERFERVLERLKLMGYASSNLVIGVGGLLLQQHNRDDLGFALKATFAVVNGEERELMKDPITDSGKKSHKGLMKLVKENGVYKTVDQVTESEESTTLLELVFKDGRVLKEYSFDEIRKRSEEV